MKAPKKKKYEKGGSVDEKSPSIYDFPNMLTLKEHELPEIKEWKVGEKYTITLEVEQTSMRKKEDGTMCAEFKILGASTEGSEESDEEGYKKGGKVKKDNKLKDPKTVIEAKKSKSIGTKAEKKYINQFDMY